MVIDNAFCDQADADDCLITIHHRSESKVKSTATTATKKSSNDNIMASATSSSGENLVDEIAKAAYFKAEARGFMSGQELDDWLEAEAELRTTHAQ